MGLARIGMGVYLRQCRAGERLSLRIDEFHPPIVIVPRAPDVVPDLAKMPPADELPEFVQRRIIAAQAEALLRQKRYDVVEAISQGYLKSAAQFPSGASKFSAIGAAFVYDEVDPTKAEIEGAVKLAEAWLAALPESNAAKLTLAATLSESVEWTTNDNGFDDGDIDAVRRRALELVYDVEQSGCTAAELYQTALRMGYLANWDEEIVDRYFERALKSGTWCPEALAMAYLNYTRIYKNADDYDRWQRVKKYFQQLTDGARDKFGAAMLAAVVKEVSFLPQDSALHSAGLEWKQVQAGFEALRLRYPSSQFNLQQYCRWACVFGDRDTAARLFKELGEFPVDELENVWRDDLEVQMRRHWSSAEFAVGKQDILFDHPSRDLAFARWRDGQNEILFCDSDGVAWIINVATGGRLRWGRGSAGPVNVLQGVFYCDPSQNFVTFGGYGGSFTRLRLKERDKRLVKFTSSGVTATTMHPSGKWGPSRSPRRRIANLRSRERGLRSAKNGGRQRPQRTQTLGVFGRVTTALRFPGRKSSHPGISRSQRAQKLAGHAQIGELRRPFGRPHEAGHCRRAAHSNFVAG